MLQLAPEFSMPPPVLDELEELELDELLLDEELLLEEELLPVPPDALPKLM